MSASALEVAGGVLGTWVLTLLLHGTLLLGGAWLLARSRRVPPGVCEAGWKLALTTTLLGATLQVALVDEPAGGRPLVLRSGTAREGAQVPGEADGPLRAGSPPEAASSGVPVAPATRPVGNPQGPAETWKVWLAGAVLLLACGGSLRRLLQGRRVRRRLGSRRAVSDPAVLALLAGTRRRMGLRRPTRLTTCEGLASPVAFGLLRPEICLPARALGVAERRHLPAILAHESAHHARRDPLWLMVFGWAAACFPWQPLLHVGRRRFQDLAEMACDAQAAALLDRLSVARCLVAVAGWMLRPGPKGAAALCGMAMSGGGLRRRVEGLLAGRAPGRVRTLPALLLGLVLVPAAALGLPGGPPPPPARGGSPAEHGGGPASGVRAAGPGTTQGLAEAYGALEAELDRLRAGLKDLGALVDRHGDAWARARLARLQENLRRLQRRRMHILRLIRMNVTRPEQDRAHAPHDEDGL